MTRWCKWCKFRAKAQVHGLHVERVRPQQSSSPTSSLRSQASALSMSSFLPPSPAVHPDLLWGSLRAPCPAGWRSSKVDVLQEKSRSLFRTTSIMSGVCSQLSRRCSLVRSLVLLLLWDHLQFWQFMGNSRSLAFSALWSACACWRSRSDVSALSRWPGAVYHFVLGGGGSFTQALTHTHTHRQCSLGWRGGCQLPWGDNILRSNI